MLHRLRAVEGAASRRVLQCLEPDGIRRPRREPGHGPVGTLAANKGYDQKALELRRMEVTPHVAQNEKQAGGSAIDGRTTRHEGYRIPAAAA